jgi:putative phosphoserine phosphatase/1-acylglycerol-3-phosphate O-acyltransferase
MSRTQTTCFPPSTKHLQGQRQIPPNQPGPEGVGFPPAPSFVLSCYFCLPKRAFGVRKQPEGLTPHYRYVVNGVAIFDLDRTLIAGSSARVFGQMLRDVGIGLPSPPGRALYFGLSERFGDDPMTVRIARYAARLFKGQSAAKVETAGRLAADVLSSDLLGPAAAEIERHRSNGTQLLLVTTAPVELAAPFVEAVGFDDVLCSRYRLVEGIYDGTCESSCGWGEDKAQAIAEWALKHDVDLTQSWAYSDSWYDVPLLTLVGHPVAVNADLRLNVLARARRWDRQPVGG